MEIWSNNIEDINNNKMKDINFNDYEFNSLEYEEALKYDKRTYFKYYLSLLRMKHILIFTFFICNDYNSSIIKICFFLFSFSLYITINSLFFTESTIHKIYEDEGAFNFVYHIPQVLYSLIVSGVINALLSFLSSTQKNILQLKTEKYNLFMKSSKTIKCLKIKFILFFIFSFIFLIVFWLYLGCFCAVYRNSQIHLIKDTLISYGLGLIYPFGINLIPGYFRINSLRSPNKDKKCMYKISQILQLF